MKCFRNALHALLAAGVLLVHGCVMVSELFAPRVTIPHDCRQLIAVTTPDWKSTAGTMQLWEQTKGGRWRPKSDRWPVVVGRNGMRRGTGLHRNPPLTLRKREGDGCSPAGLFALGTAFGRGTSVMANFPWLEITREHAGVDDPRSVYYNTIVSRRAVSPDWTSAEDMMPASGVYDKALVVRHNAERRPGAGSCIFLHIWSERRTPTAGCTAMSEENMALLLRWLDATKHPLILQLPAQFYHGRPGHGLEFLHFGVENEVMD